MNMTYNLSTSARNECSFSEEDPDNPYDLTLHIISIFILLMVSCLGAIISVVSVRSKRLHVNPIIINTAKFFGSGVVLATGFIHMLPPAMEALTNPCLPDGWNVYSAYACLFAMLSALVMQFIEFLSHEKYRSIKKSDVHPLLPSQSEEFKSERRGVDGKTVSPIATIEEEHSNSNHHDHDHHHHHHHHHHSHGVGFQDDAHANKISTYLLEFGIALHSVLIGMALGTTSESFVPLLTALSFHQFFEAIALGAQIARLDRVSLRSVLFMVVFFALTTPVGIAIGIGIYSTTYNPESVAFLLVNGILDSISAGILIYVALINLISAEMGPGAHSFYSLSKRLKFLYFAALYAGVAAMAVIGIWA